MRIDRSRLRRPASLLGIATMVLGSFLVAAPAARANTEPVDFSTVDAIKAYLSSKGVGTTNVVVQEGTDNYYGASCPGVEWTCATPSPTDEAVIQRTTTGQNVYDIVSSGLCVVVQTSTTGTNSASCDLYSGSGDWFSLVGQETVDGGNSASIYQYSSETGVETSDISQSIDVHQQVAGEGTGSNTSYLTQDIYQSSTLTAPVVQTQFSSQGASVDQFSRSGPNNSDLYQTLYQFAAAVGTDAEQHQNDVGDQEYQRNRVNQQSVSGTNDSVLESSTEQKALIGPGVGGECCYAGPAAAAAMVVGATQVQGCTACGIVGSLNQGSSGVSTATATLNEYQEVFVDPTVASPMQSQTGPATVPVGGDEVVPPGTINGVRCCSNQSGNPSNLFDVTISSTQLSDRLSSPQHNYIRASCETSGSCTAGTTVNQDGLSTTESCTGSRCSIAIRCPDGEDCATTGSTEPDTAITAAPESKTPSPSATFEFTGTEAGGFICALDEGAWEACSSPKTYDGLAEGSHLFRVSAVDIAGNVDQTPAAASWIIDSLLDTFIDSGPSGYENGTAAKFTFHGSFTATGFQCRLDGGAWAACSSPKTVKNLAEGSHTFAVRATDDFGRSDPTPAVAGWIVDIGLPSSTFATRTGAVKVGTPFGNDVVSGKAFDSSSGIDRVEVTFSFAGLIVRSIDHAKLTCNATRSVCSWETEVVGLPPGLYSVTKQAFDRAGNAEQRSSVFILVV